MKRSLMAHKMGHKPIHTTSRRHQVKHEQAQTVEIKKRNILTILFITTAVCAVVSSAVSWLGFTAYKLSGGKMPWERK